jgi:hypothetical protein
MELYGDAYEEDDMGSAEEAGSDEAEGDADEA